MSKFDFAEMFKEIEDSIEFRTETKILKITENIVAKMDAKNISRKDLAGKLGCKPAYITKLLRGNNNFTLNTMMKISEALDLDFNFGFKEKESSYTVIKSDPLQILNELNNDYLSSLVTSSFFSENGPYKLEEVS